MSGAGIVSLGCAILSAHTTLTPVDGGWDEAVALELAGGPSCTHLRIGLPDGATLGSWSGRVLRDDAPNHPVDPARMLAPEPTPEGAVRQLQLQDLAEGDRLRLTLLRRWPDASPRYVSPEHLVVVQPRSGGAQPFKGAQWEAKGGALRVDLPLPSSGDASDDAEASSWARFDHPWASSHPVVVPPTAQRLSLTDARRRLGALMLLPRAVDGLAPVLGDAAVARGAVCDRGYARTLLALVDDPELTLVAAVPEGPHDTSFLHAEAVYDPRTDAVYVHPNHHRARRFALPDGRIATVGPSTATALPDAEVGVTVLTVALPDRDAARAVHPDAGALLHTALPLRAGRDGAVALLPLPDTAAHARAHLPAGAAATVWGGAYRVYLPPHQRAVLSWRQPLEDVGGLLPAGATAATVVVRSPAAALDARVRVEAGAWALTSIEGQQLSSTPERTHAELSRRIREAAYPEPGVPLRLRGLDDGWDRATALIDAVLGRISVTRLNTPPWWPRPLHRARSRGVLTELEAAAVLSLYARQSRLDAEVVFVRTPSPAPFAPGQEDAVLVRWRHEGESRWTDLACAVCAPFEVRPSLAGGAALGGDSARVPDAFAQGSRSADGSDVVLTGAHALRLRLALADATQQDEIEALLHEAAGGAVRRAEGLDEAGAPVRLTLSTPAAPSDAPPSPAR